MFLMFEFRQKVGMFWSFKQSRSQLGIQFGTQLSIQLNIQLIT